VSAIVILAALADAALAALVLSRLRSWRRRGVSMRMRLFAALGSSVLLGALVTGLYAVALDARTIGFGARLASVAPKAFVLASGLLALAALTAAVVGRRLARPVEMLADAAAILAEGSPEATLPRPGAGEARRIARALVSLRGEAARAPYAAAFLRDAWHDLKTPLSAIRATVELLEDGALQDPVAAKRFVANLSRAAADLDRMLADLVTLARMETAAIHRERATPMAEVVEGAIDRIAPLALARGVAITGRQGAEAGTVRCDAASVGRALSNLLENAIDASPGGRVGVSLDGTPAAVVVEVFNEPGAVSRGVREHLFERSVTAGSGRGSGLGLAIARAAIEAHGGRVHFVELGPPRVRVRMELPR
jgi:signal transduction histidine kinase